MEILIKYTMSSVIHKLSNGHMVLLRYWEPISSTFAGVLLEELITTNQCVSDALKQKSTHVEMRPNTWLPHRDSGASNHVAATSRSWWMYDIGCRTCAIALCKTVLSSIRFRTSGSTAITISIIISLILLLSIHWYRVKILWEIIAFRCDWEEIRNKC